MIKFGTKTDPKIVDIAHRFERSLNRTISEAVLEAGPVLADLGYDTKDIPRTLLLIASVAGMSETPDVEQSPSRQPPAFVDPAPQPQRPPQKRRYIARRNSVMNAALAAVDAGYNTARGVINVVLEMRLISKPERSARYIYELLAKSPPFKRIRTNPNTYIVDPGISLTSQQRGLSGRIKARLGPGPGFIGEDGDDDTSETSDSGASNPYTPSNVGRGRTYINQMGVGAEFRSQEFADAIGLTLDQAHKVTYNLRREGCIERSSPTHWKVIATTGRTG